MAVNQAVSSKIFSKLVKYGTLKLKRAAHHIRISDSMFLCPPSQEQELLFPFLSSSFAYFRRPAAQCCPLHFVLCGKAQRAQMGFEPSAPRLQVGGTFSTKVGSMGSSCVKQPVRRRTCL